MIYVIIVSQMDSEMKLKDSLQTIDALSFLEAELEYTSGVLSTQALKGSKQTQRDKRDKGNAKRHYNRKVKGAKLPL